MYTPLQFDVFVSVHYYILLHCSSCLYNFDIFLPGNLSSMTLVALWSTCWKCISHDANGQSSINTVFSIPCLPMVAVLDKMSIIEMGFLGPFCICTSMSLNVWEQTLLLVGDRCTHFVWHTMTIALGSLFRIGCLCNNGTRITSA